MAAAYTTKADIDTFAAPAPTSVAVVLVNALSSSSRGHSSTISTPTSATDAPIQSPVVSFMLSTTAPHMKALQKRNALQRATATVRAASMKTCVSFEQQVLVPMRRTHVYRAARLVLVWSSEQQVLVPMRRTRVHRAARLVLVSSSEQQVLVPMRRTRVHRCVSFEQRAASVGTHAAHTRTSVC